MRRHWLDAIEKHTALDPLLGRLESGAWKTAEGAWGSSAHLLGGMVARRTGRPVLLVVGHLDSAEEAVDDLGLFEGLSVAAFPALEVLPGESGVSRSLVAERMRLVQKLSESAEPGMLVAPIQALMQAVPDPVEAPRWLRTLRASESLDPQVLMEWLVDADYRRVDSVEEAGDFAVRGGLIDVLAEDEPPVRLEFFGDRIESICEFDLNSLAPDRKRREVTLLSHRLDAMETDAHVGLWTLLNSATVVVYTESMEVFEQARGYYERLNNPVGIFSPQTVQKKLQAHPVISFDPVTPEVLSKNPVRLPIGSLRNFDRHAHRAVAELGQMIEDGEVDSIVVLCRREAEKERLEQLIGEHAGAYGDRIVLEVGSLQRGFVWDGVTAVVPHQELFHRHELRRRVRRVGRGGGSEVFFDIEPGDYVVHRDHGIARFKSLRLMDRGPDDPGQEYLSLEFAGRALLHVPSTQIDRVQKYVGGAGRPSLSKLGGGRWKKQKAQVAEAVEKLAAEMLRLQAARQSLPGVAHLGATDWSRRFEAEFPYEETEDQLAAMSKIAQDMSTARPMDRLICGDVGYGKTELAVRAAFKAVESGHQVAVLCPTTVLCQQHERTFRQRMADYPIRIEALNRFRTGSQTAEILSGMRDGTVDIVIGTHRLLSEDVTFRDLGLVVVDEEQRFGVEHKQRLMRYRMTVDVLTMSATPIPRTLNMALLGLRDISSLSTAPADRRSVVTEVVPHENDRIRSAIIRELNRDGQCYFLHNRVRSIHAVAEELRALVPEARIAVGHGQMPARQLEEVMLQFVDRKIDVLVCTTIIESGIDVPTANTIFIADCDRFGLAELHQLRGRVGRYKHRAYAYLLLPKTRALSDVALQRLHAIEAFSMLGAGFKIAVRDMEIRGVGNLLGPQQSGHIVTIGYQLYCSLLEEATCRLRKDPMPQAVAVHVDIGVHGHLPLDYIRSEKRRMDWYRRLGQARDAQALRSLLEDMTAAYGPPPEPAMLLFHLSQLRVALGELAVAGLTVDGPDLIFATQQVRRVAEALAGAAGSVRIVDLPKEGRDGSVYYRPPGKPNRGRRLLAGLLNVLRLEPMVPAQ